MTQLIYIPTKKRCLHYLTYGMLMSSWNKLQTFIAMTYVLVF